MKVDLHTHSNASPDGGLRPEHYRHMLTSGNLDVIAVTDHNTIAAALRLRAELGEGIIVGEEISTDGGDIIGLYVTRAVPAGLPAREAVRLVHEQGGLVYVPHPFVRLRSSAGTRLLASLAGQIDILEVHNGRTLGRWHNAEAQAWAVTHSLPGAASSDAHGISGWGKTYTIVPETPTVHTLPALLLRATYHLGQPSLRAMLYPGANRLRKRFSRD